MNGQALLIDIIGALVAFAVLTDLRSQTATAYWANANLNLERKVNNAIRMNGPAYSIPS